MSTDPADALGNDQGEQVVSFLVPVGTAVNDSALIQQAEHVVHQCAEQRGVAVEDGPTYVKTTTNCQMKDRYGALIYDGLPPGMALYVFTWVASEEHHVH